MSSETFGAFSLFARTFETAFFPLRATRSTDSTGSTASGRSQLEFGLNSAENILRKKSFHLGGRKGISEKRRFSAEGRN
jgi:hypothetical protein